MHAQALALALISATLAAPSSQPTGRATIHLRPCEATDLSHATDSENGAFNGMSHSGTLVILRNLSPTACSVPAIPQLTLIDSSNKPLPATPQLPGARFMHPGPVVLPIPLAPGAELTATLRWVSGPVYTDNLCLDATSLDITVAGTKLRTRLLAHLCGERTTGVSYQLSRFSTDPFYKPKKTP